VARTGLVTPASRLFYVVEALTLRRTLRARTARACLGDNHVDDSWRREWHLLESSRLCADEQAHQAGLPDEAA
jgi:hypothetical protein